jgi:hypothetical protein
MIKVLCFNCGSMFTVPNMTDNPTKQCRACIDKLEDGLLDAMFGNKKFD